MKSITCGTGWLTAIHMWNKDTGFVVGAGGRVQWTTDGQNWSDISTPTQDHLYDLTFVGRDTGYIVGEGGLILRSVDSGRTWNTHSDTAMATLRAITVIQDTLYAVGEKGLILRSPDRGNEWNKMVTPVKQDLLDVTFRQGTGYAVGGQGTILRWAATDTAGWQLQQTPTQQLLSSVDFLTPRIGYVSGAQGVVLKTTNGGITSRSLSPVTSYNINIRPQPVHHTATVTLYVPHESRPIEQYSLVIYDVQGQRITTIDRGNRNADRYVFHFSTSDLTAGLYFYEVKYEQQSVAQGKLVVQ